MNLATYPAAGPKGRHDPRATRCSKLLIARTSARKTTAQPQRAVLNALLAAAPVDDIVTGDAPDCPIALHRQAAPNDAPMFVKVLVAGVSGGPVMGHSGEGRLL
jgi:hypothetical protein